MTTVQTMLCAPIVCVLAVSGCGQQRAALVSPNVIQSPYDAAKGDTLWAVAPLANESGVSTIDTLAISDALAAAVAEVNGVTALPVNRTLAAMSARDLRAIRTPREARLIADTLKVQGIIVGTVTAYDPYDPPKIGLTLALYTTDADPAGAVNPRDLSSSYSDRHVPRSSFTESPASVVAEHLDAASHAVLLNLQEFAHGRHEPETALGWKRYTASMELYTEFAAFHCVRQLVQSERRRLAGGARAEHNAAISATQATTPPASVNAKPDTTQKPPTEMKHESREESQTTTHVPSGDHR